MCFICTYDFRVHCAQERFIQKGKSFLVQNFAQIWYVTVTFNCPFYSNLFRSRLAIIFNSFVQVCVFQSWYICPSQSDVVTAIKKYFYCRNCIITWSSLIIWFLFSTYGILFVVFHGVFHIIFSRCSVNLYLKKYILLCDIILWRNRMSCRYRNSPMFVLLPFKMMQKTNSPLDFSKT